MKIKFAFILFILSLSSCLMKDKNKLPVIDITTIEKTSKSLSCGDIFNEVKYIPLETTKECLLAGNSLIEQISENYVLIKSDNNLLLFRDNGNFVTKIGARGEGPNEYLAISDAFINEKLRSVSIFDDVKKKIFMYSLAGEFINSVSIKVPNTKLYNIKPISTGGYITFQHISEALKIGDKYKLFTVYSDDWKELFSYYSFDKLPANYKPNFLNYGEVRNSQNGLEIFVPFNDTIFISDFSKKEFTPKYIIRQGRKKLPRTIAENFDEYTKLKYRYFINVISHMSRNYLFVKFENGEESLCLMIFNMSNGEFIHSQSLSYQKLSQEVTVGLSNLKDPKINFWPSYFNKDGAYSILDAQTFKNNSLSVLAKTIKDADNPILIFGVYPK